MRRLFSLGLIALLAGCASSNNYYAQTVNSWRGANVSTLVKQWGTPDDQSTGPYGNSLYIYKTVSYSNFTQPTGPSVGVGTSRSGAPEITTQAPNTNMTWNRGMSLSCIVAFTADKTGKIVNTQISGQTCYGGLKFAKKMSNPATPVVPIKTQ